MEICMSEVSVQHIGLKEPATAEFVYSNLYEGDLFPRFRQRCGEKEQFAFDSLAGRYQLYCFYMTEGDRFAMEALAAVEARERMFDGPNWIFVGVGVHTPENTSPRLQNRGAVFFANDIDLSVCKLCGVAPLSAELSAAFPARRVWIIVDPTLHVLKIFRLGQGSDPAEVFDFMASLPPPNAFGGKELPAPIIVLPNVFEPQVCERLISYYDEVGGSESGVMRNGVGVYDNSFKKRADLQIEASLRTEVKNRIVRRVLPEIERLFFMRISFIERYIVACYSAKDGGHFSPHRDNSPGVTAHRRFALSINLNDDFGGGEVVFPEYGMRGYKAKAGWAIVFPCAALHQVNRVTSGARYACLPFLDDEEGERIRQRGLALQA